MSFVLCLGLVSARLSHARTFYFIRIYPWYLHYYYVSRASLAPSSGQSTSEPHQRLKATGLWRLCVIWKGDSVATFSLIEPSALEGAASSPSVDAEQQHAPGQQSHASQCHHGCIDAEQML